MCGNTRMSLFKSMGEKSAADRRKEISAKRRGWRMEELDRLFQRLYEDNICGKISYDQFTKLSGDYEAEQKGLQEQAMNLTVTSPSSRSISR